MTPLEFVAGVFGISLVAGVLGSMLGLGGGIVVVPALTLLFKLDIRYAVGASIVSVIATSSGAAASYVRQHLSNLRVAMLLEVSTATGAISGAFLAGILAGKWLYVIFASVMALTGLAMWRDLHHGDEPAAPVKPDRLADRLRLHSSYYDPALGRTVEYRVRRTWLGLIVSYIAGIVSGLLGVGGGVLKVPAMTLGMGMPIKTATATSNFMIGVTAAASAGVYFMRGEIDPIVAGPTAAGVLIGATAGAKLLPKLHSKVVRVLLVVVLLWTAYEMMRKGVGNG